MNINKLLSSKERIKILQHVLYKKDPFLVSKTAKELKLSKALVSQFFEILRQEKILKKNKDGFLSTDELAAKSVRILITTSSIPKELFQKDFILSAGIFGSAVKGTNNEDSDIDIWILTNSAKEDNLEELTKSVKSYNDKISITYLTKEKLKHLEKNDTVFYYSLVFGSIIIRGDSLDSIR